MPPVVNAGLCFALATHLEILGNWQSYANYTIDDKVYRFKPAWVPPPNYTPDYVNDMRIECCILAVISIGYTFVNVFCLLAASYIILKVTFISITKSITTNDNLFCLD